MTERDIALNNRRQLEAYLAAAPGRGIDRDVLVCTAIVCGAAIVMRLLGRHRRAPVLTLVPDPGPWMDDL